MIKDAKMTSHQFVDVVVSSLAEETSDGIFEKQFDFVHAAINTYTPEKFRKELNSKMYQFIFELIPKIPENQQNRIVILKGKLLSFAYSEDEIKQMISWQHGELEHLKKH